MDEQSRETFKLNQTVELNTYKIHKNLKLKMRVIFLLCFFLAVTFVIADPVQSTDNIEADLPQALNERGERAGCNHNQCVSFCWAMGFRGASKNGCVNNRCQCRIR